MKSKTEKSAFSAKAQYLKMTETPVSRLILTLGIPTTITMLITNIYNLADSYFASKISLGAGGATSVVFGIMSIIQAFGFMFGHGSGSYVSRLLGAKDNENASRYASTGFFWSIFCGTAISLLGIAFLRPLMIILGSTETILPHAMDYGLFIFLAAPAMTASCVLNNVLRYEGRAALAMIGLTFGGVLNIILDPIFIFLFKLDILGAGLATAISQYISFGILLSMFLRGKTQSKLSLKYVAKEFKIISDIVVTGLPSLARQGLNSVSVMVLNAAAKPIGDAAIAAMGYVARTSHFIFSAGLGIGQGFQPVSAFNYGAKNYSRVKKGTLFTWGFGTALLGSLAVICLVFAPDIISLFRSEKEVIDIGGMALRFYCISLIFFATSVVATMLFQSIGRSGSALLLSCLQSGAVFIPLCIILTYFFGTTGLALSQPIAYAATSFVSMPMMLSFLKRLPKDDE